MYSVVCPPNSILQLLDGLKYLALSFINFFLLSSFLLCIFPSIWQCKLQTNLNQAHLPLPVWARVLAAAHRRWVRCRLPWSEPLQSSELRHRHSTSSSPSQVPVGPEQLKHEAQACPKQPRGSGGAGIQSADQFSPAALFTEQHRGHPAGADLFC